jgi:hypothetical protein
MTVDYHDIKPGMVFIEARQDRTPRTVMVVGARLYSCTCDVVRGRGAGTELQLARKALSDPQRWTLVAAENGGPT